MHEIRNISSPYSNDNAFWDKWNSANPRMALFLKFTPAVAGRSTIGFTSNSRDMTLAGHSGVVFKSAAGLTPSAIEQRLNEAVNLELTGIFTEDTFTRDDVLNGYWDFGEIEIFSAPWDTPAMGELLHFRGNLGEFKDYESFFTAEGRGMIARLSANPTAVTTRTCRVRQFKDSKCGFTGDTVTIDSITYSLTLNSTEASWYRTGAWGRMIGIEVGAGTTTLPLGNPIPPSGFFNNGVLTINSGEHAGLKREILGYDYSSETGTINLSVKRSFPTFEEGAIGSITLEAGCNRTLEDCRKYNNVINFRGEPYIPGIEAMNRIPPSQ